MMNTKPLWYRSKFILFLFLLSGQFIVSEPIHAQASCDLDSITDEFGQYVTVDEAGSPRVFLLQENHSLVTGQIEGAIMINRLIEDCGLRTIGLEAAFPSSDISAPWFTGTDVGVAVSILGEGEISQTEFAAMVYPSIYPNFKVIGIDNEEIYNRGTPDVDFGALDTLMFYTALMQLDDDDFDEALDMLNNVPDEDPEAYAEWREGFLTLVYTENPDERIVEWDRRTDVSYDECMYSSIETDIENFDFEFEIVEDLREDTEVLLESIDEDFDALMDDAVLVREFYQNAHDRSVTMVEEIEKYLNENPDSLILAVTGASHTQWMFETLRNDNFETAILSPNSLCDPSTAVALGDDAYENKISGLPVNTSGDWEELLNNDIKPPVVLDEPWFQTKAMLYSIAARVTREIRNNPNANFDDIVANLPPMAGITIDTASWSPVDGSGGRYTFAIDLNISGVSANRIYIGIAPDIQEGEDDLNIEQMLRGELGQLHDLLGQQRADGSIGDDETGILDSSNASSRAAALTEVSPDVSAIFGTSEERTAERTRDA